MRSNLAVVLPIDMVTLRNGEGQEAQPFRIERGDPYFTELSRSWGEKLREAQRSEEHTSELQSLMRISYAVFCLKKKQLLNTTTNTTYTNLHKLSLKDFLHLPYRITNKTIETSFI